MSSDSPGASASATVLKVVVVGEGGAGKTSLLNRLGSGIFDPHVSHTVGVECLKRELNEGGRDFVLQLWDTAGQERFRSLRTPFYRGADAAVLVFALDSALSFRRLEFWYSEFSQHARLSGEFPVVVVGAKADAEGREVEAAEAERWAAAKGLFPYVETSAASGHNVEEAFRTLVRAWTNLASSHSDLDDSGAHVQLGQGGVVSLSRSPSRRQHTLHLSSSANGNILLSFGF